MKRTSTVSAPGKTLADAFDVVFAGFFTDPNPPNVAIEEAHKHGHKVYRFKLTVELLEEITPTCPTCKGAKTIPCPYKPCLSG